MEVKKLVFKMHHSKLGQVRLKVKQIYHLSLRTAKTKTKSDVFLLRSRPTVYKRKRSEKFGDWGTVRGTSLFFSATGL